MTIHNTLDDSENSVCELEASTERKKKTEIDILSESYDDLCEMFLVERKEVLLGDSRSRSIETAIQLDNLKKKFLDLQKKAVSSLVKAEYNNEEDEKIQAIDKMLLNSERYIRLCERNKEIMIQLLKKTRDATIYFQFTSEGKIIIDLIRVFKHVAADYLHSPIMLYRSLHYFNRAHQDALILDNIEIQHW